MHEFRSEIGSFFQWSSIPSTNDPDRLLELPKEAKFVASGRCAFSLVAEGLGGKRTLHVPAFFCPQVVTHLERLFEVRYYQDSPENSEPCWESLSSVEDGVVLWVNFFGLRDREALNKWIEAHPKVIVVEDQTHCPLSVGQSSAHFVVASLRKLFPMPDGAYCYSPRGILLPELDLSPPGLLQEFFEASLSKAVYLEGGHIEKQKYLDGFGRHEAKFDCLNGRYAMSNFSRNMLSWMDAVGILRKRARNMEYLRQAAVRANISESVRILLPSNCDNGFNPLLVFPDAQTRDRVHTSLIRSAIYAPILWNVENKAQSQHHAKAVELAGRVLTLPLDQRYGESDVDRILSVLAEALRE